MHNISKARKLEEKYTYTSNVSSDDVMEVATVLDTTPKRKREEKDSLRKVRATMSRGKLNIVFCHSVN